jgi:hypothetical protein
MNPHRPRKPRTDGAALRFVEQWRTHVERTERLTRKGGHHPTDPRWEPECCRPHDDHARDRLESLMHNGGRRAHRLRAAVARLDERFVAVTVERDTAWKSAPWWDRREPLD